MAWNIPRQIGSLLVGDDTTQRALTNLGRATQPLLDFFNSSFSVAQTGVLNVIRSIVVPAVSVQGPATVTGPLTVNGVTTLNANGNVINGSLLVVGKTGNAFVVVPFDLTAAFYVTNPANTATNFVVNGSGTVVGTNTWTTTSFVSGAGFKSWIKMGSYWNSNVATTNNKNTIEILYAANNSATSTVNRQWAAPRPGSVTAFTVIQTGVASAVFWQILKNGNAVTTLTVAANAAQAYVTFAKGQYVFNAGDVFTCTVTANAGVNFAGQCDIEIETGA